jgi:acetyl-CoA carboxylase biotin carboxyl carrier protein
MSDDSKLPDIAYVSELAKLFKRFQLGELEIETGEQRISMRRSDAGGAPMFTPMVAPMPMPTAPVAPVAGPAPVPTGSVGATSEPHDVAGDYITSPFVGTFYSRPRPNEPAFVTPGSTVTAGQTVCIVEAMKLFNEIEAEFACVVEEMLVHDQQPVEFGTKLFRVRRL